MRAPAGGTIIALGGGELRELETLSIDEEIIARTGKRSPRVLFIPTASGDSVSYWNTFNKVYGRRLGCRTDLLNLITADHAPSDISRTISSADAIYVGGGNTLKMMRRWRFLGVDTMLREAYERGTVLSGLSAGAICWFAHGTSDSRRFYNPSNDRLIRVRGLGLVDALFSPHHLTEPARERGIADIMRRTPGVGLAVDDCAAILITGGNYRIIGSRPDVGVRRVFVRRGETIIEPIAATDEMRPLNDLLNPSPSMHRPSATLPSSSPEGASHL